MFLLSFFLLLERCMNSHLLLWLIFWINTTSLLGEYCGMLSMRHLKGEDISSFNCRELMILEDALENGLTRICDKQNEFFRMVRKKTQNMEQELNSQLRQLEIASINRNIGEIGEVFEQTTNAFCLESPT
ncbi:hypothetical protein RDI58_020335 [Solanum bulbocastanum]|uniref:K-box domain-containing protein n=1 Tax=Solanum bulbocastanum TaxID=147425 RepID=A0AAN8T9S7_SOLBU